MRLVHLPAVRSRSLETLSHTALSVAHLWRTGGHDVAAVFNAANAPFLPALRAARVPVAVHVDGLEWQRDKWSGAGRRYYRWAEAFAVVTEPVYRYYFSPYEAEEAATISNQRHRIENVRDRVGVARLVDAFLDEHGLADVKPDKDYKFLKHDLRLYLGDLPYRTAEWIKQFAEETTPYLAGLAPEAFRRLPRDQRVVIRLVRRR